MKAFRTTALTSLSLVALALVAAVPAAYADTLDVYGTPAVNDSNSITNPVPITVAQFNNVTGIYAGDTLNSVEVILSGNGSTDYNYELIALTGYVTGSNAHITALTTTASLTLTGNSVNETLTINGTDSIPGGATFNTSSGLLTYQGGNLLGTTIDAYPSITGFAGTGTLGFTLDGGASTNYIGSAPNDSLVAVGGSTDAGATVEVIYDYSTPGPGNTPEPGTLTLFGTGLLGLAGMLRSKFLQAR